MSSEVESKMVSRRKILPLLGLAAALVFAVSPIGAEAQTTGTTSAPSATSAPSTSGTAGMHRRQSGAMDASNGATSGAAERPHQNSPHKPRLRKPRPRRHRLHKNSS